MPNTYSDFTGNWYKLEDVIRFGASNKDVQHRWLSNFHPIRLEIDGHTYFHVEGYYQAAKFLDSAPSIASEIRLKVNPRAAKAAGRKNKMTKDQMNTWNSGGSEATMLKALRAKYLDPELRRKLVETGSKVLVESAGRDKNWGAGLKGEGLNRLGKLIMLVREEILLEIAESGEETAKAEQAVDQTTSLVDPEDNDRIGISS